MVQDDRNHPIDNRMMDTKVFDIDGRSYRNLEVLEHDNIRSFCSRRGNVDSVKRRPHGSMMKMIRKMTKIK